jgi:hypothetical protein
MAEQKNYETDLKDLWNILISLPPDKQKELVDKIPESLLNVLRTSKNPFNKSVMVKNDDRILAFNFINLKEKYLRRFSMTSLIAFIYRMCDEYKPKIDKNLKLESENSAKYADLYNPLLKKLKFDRPNALCDTIVDKCKIAGAIKLLEKDPTKDDKEEIKKIFASLPVKALTYFVCVDKKCKHNLEQLKKTRDAINNEAVRNEKETTLNEAQLETHKLRVLFVTKKKDLIEKYLADKLAHPENYKNENLPKYAEMPTEERKKDDPYHGLDKKKIEAAILTPSDKSRPQKVWEKELSLRKKEVQIFEDKLKALQLKTNAFGTELKKNNDEIDKFNKISLQNEKLCLIVNPDLHKKIQEIKNEEYQPTEEEFLALRDKVKLILGVQKTEEEYIDEKRDIIYDFLNEYFSYDPDNHVKCAYKPNYEDEFRTPIINLTTAKINGKLTPAEYNKRMDIVKTKIKKYRETKEQNYATSVLPPSDTFARLDRYVENNYEELRQATDDIYGEKSDLEVMIVPQEVFSGRDAEEQADMWQRKYAAEFESDIYRAHFNQWTFISPWAQNREKRNFYTKNSEIIKRIIEQSESDSKMGRDLMKKRKEAEKKRNIDEVGPDDPGLFDRKKEVGSELEKYGVDGKIDKLPSSSTDANAKEQEINWIHMKPQRKKGGHGFRAETTAGHFNIPEEEPSKDSQGFLMGPEQSQKQQAEGELLNTIEETKKKQQ